MQKRPPWQPPLTAEEVAQAVERAQVALAGLEGPSPQLVRSLAGDVVRLADTLSALRVMFEDAT